MQSDPLPANPLRVNTSETNSLSTKRIVYLNNAATSFPKPPGVVNAVVEALNHMGGSPGRGGQRISKAASETVWQARQAVARLFGIADPRRVIFTGNATEALNLAIHGFLRPGDHVVTTVMEHNSVLRPLKALERTGVTNTKVAASPEGYVEPLRIKEAIRPNTRLIVTVHGSNVTGTLLPIEAIGSIARERGIPYLVDAAQTAGIVPIDVRRAGISLLACPGHKGLLGPQGTGFLYISEELTLRPLKQGGTGIYSELEDQPDVLPERYESGSLNTPGLAGLSAGVEFLLETGVEQVRRKEKRLTSRFIDGLLRVPGVQVYGPLECDGRVGVVSFNIDGFPPETVGNLLEERGGVIGRTGLHCAPLVHKLIGTFPLGTVRLSLSYFTTESELDHTLDVIEEVALSRTAFPATGHRLSSRPPRLSG